MLPTGKSEPDGKSVASAALPQLSAAVGSVHETIAPQTPGSFVMVMSAGTPLKVGGSGSITVIVNEAVSLLPFTSVAV